MTRKLLIFDQEDTLVQNQKLIPGTIDFLRDQSRHHECIIATSAASSARNQLEEVADYIHGYFSFDLINQPFCENSDGRLKAVKKGSDTITKYQNPHLPPSIQLEKDLHLTKRLYAPDQHKELNSLMIGNLADLAAVATDPETPLILVDPTWLTRKRANLLIKKLLEHSQKPHQLFDNLLAQGQPYKEHNLLSYEVDQIKISTIENTRFLLGHNKKYGVRTIVETPHF